MNFFDLGLNEKTLKAIDELGYKAATPIQEKAIPEILKRNDVIGIAQTGTGKTAAFALPMIDILSNGRAKALMPRTLILAPTRELAIQIADCFQKYGKYQKLSMVLLIGGESIAEQQKILAKGVDVLIATPGRMIDLCQRGRILLCDVQILVLDEADRMLDMGFIPDVENIISKLPAVRQTLLFSATMPSEIKALAKKFMKFPKEIRVDPLMSAANTVEQFIVKTNERGKREVLRSLIQSENVQNAMIFCNRKKDVDILLKSFTKHKFSVTALHGDMAQGLRIKTLNDFRDGIFQLLVCSDVAARGLDIPVVSHVFNFDVPANAEDYIHRIGRTGRAGQKGRAFMLVTSADYKSLASIEKMIGEKLKEMKRPSGSSDKAEVCEKHEKIQKTGAEKKSGKSEPVIKKKMKKSEKNQKKSEKNQKKNDKRPTADYLASGVEMKAFGKAMPAFMLNEVKIP